MSNYRRLISYIYAYEGGVKGKNIGFAKLEARNGQCKIQVNVKKIYMGNSDMGVYLLTEDQEILLGNMFIRNGSGEFRTVVSVTNVEQSGFGMEQCFGMTIHAVNDQWQTYTTIWEDAAVQAVRSQERETETKAVTESPDQSHAEMITHAAEIGSGIAVGTVKEDDPVVVPDRVELTAEMALRDVTSENRIREEMEHMPQQVPNVSEMGAVRESFVQELEREIQEQEEHFDTKKQDDTPEMVEPAHSEHDETGTGERSFSVQPDTLQMHSSDTGSSSDSALPQSAQKKSLETRNLPIENQELLAQLEREELEENQPERLWQYFRSNYPKVEAFDYQGEGEILMIKPQDIGLLPRETWSFGNNSFLLHGYYNYRYLTLARLKTPQGTSRYLLGVPGHYYSNEKYMASMFGFPHFVLAKMQPAGDGRFGYWYSDINLGN